VVLVTNYGGRAPIGVIVNRPTGIALAKVLPDIERLRSSDEKVFFGGPVRRAELVVLFRAEVVPAEAIEVVDGVGMSSSARLVRELLDREAPGELRVFAGHASWGRGQLEAEVARGDWHLAPADAAAIFGRNPENLWQELDRKTSAIVTLAAD
jgi:putative transcriptional regulator